MNQQILINILRRIREYYNGSIKAPCKAKSRDYIDGAYDIYIKALDIIRDEFEREFILEQALKED